MPVSARLLTWFVGALSLAGLALKSYNASVTTSPEFFRAHIGAGPQHHATGQTVEALESTRSDRFYNDTRSSSSRQRRGLFKLSDFLDPKSTTERISLPLDQNDLYLSPTQTQTKYSLYNILQTIPHFRRELFILHYSAKDDEFHVYINESKDGWVSALQNRIYQIMPMLSFALRHHFPNRFRGKKSKDFVVLASSGDEPKLDCKCIDGASCNNKEFAPILQFGAVFRDESILPSCVTMPVWHHLTCFRQWQQSASICPTYRIRAESAGLIGGDEASLHAAENVMPFEQRWESLIPQIIWRGSDFGFIWCVHPELRLIDFGLDIAKRISLSQCRDSARGILQCLSQLWEILTPRWRAVYWTMEAELDVEEMSKAEGNGAPFQQPWIDAKFTVKTHVHGHALDPKKIDRYTPYEQYGMTMASPHFMSLAELSLYRYQFDIGGGGGTTFSGTIDKLAMPGVLFHHVTATKDYYHDNLVPWMHYIPVQEGMSDLREMYEWAQANSEQAMRISEAASAYVKNWADPIVMEEMYHKYFVETLGHVVGAYQATEEDVGEILKKRKWTLIARIPGKDLGIKYTKVPSD
jgi:hypothetical protein